MIPEKQKILIVDDSEMNRAILTGILDDGYDFLEAENRPSANASGNGFFLRFGLEK